MSSKILPSITREDVSQHNTEDDCWIIIENKVYDVTKWLPKHPGGSVMILNLAGKDCTEEFKVFHLNPSYALLKPYYKGNVVEEQIKLPTEISKDVGQLLKQLKSKGAFKPDCKYIQIFGMADCQISSFMEYEARVSNINTIRFRFNQKNNHNTLLNINFLVFTKKCNVLLSYIWLSMIFSNYYD